MTTLATNYAKSNVLAFIIHPTRYPSPIFRWSLQKYGSYPVVGSGIVITVIRKFLSTDYSLDALYHGVLTECRYTADLGRRTDGNIVFPTMRLSAPRDATGQGGIDSDAVDDIRSYGYLAGFDCYFYRVSAADPLPTASNRFFVGRIARGGCTITREKVDLNITDRLSFDDAPVLKENFEDDARVQSEWRGKKIPLIFGEWRESADEYQVDVPVNQTDNSGERDFISIICANSDTGIENDNSAWRWFQSGGAVKARWVDNFDFLNKTGAFFHQNEYEAWRSSQVDWGADAPLGSTDYDPAKSDTFAWQDGDTLKMKSCRGLRIHGGTTAAKNPVDVIVLILRDSVFGLNIAAADIDAADALAKTTAFKYYCRSYVKDEVNAFDLISRICYEFGLKVIVVGGRYKAVLLDWDAPDTANATVIQYGQILKWTDSGDKNKEGFDGIEIEYRKMPDGEMTRSLKYEDIAIKSGAGVHKMSSEWIYDEATALTRAGIFQFLHGGSIQTVTFNLDFSCLGIELTETILAPLEENGRPSYYYVTRLEVDNVRPIITVDGLNINTVGPLGVWADEIGTSIPENYGGAADDTDLVPSTFALAGEVATEYLSYWTDDTGEDNPDGEPSKIWSQ